MTTKDGDGLFPAPRAKVVPGPIYQGVSKTIRALIDAEKLDRKIDAGSIAQARSLASSIDRVSGHTLPQHQASGVSLAALHAQLSEVLERLDPTGASDPFQDFLEELDKEGAPNNGHAPAPHPEV